MTTLLGCVADDLTGATDLALVLSANGMRTVLVLDPPPPGSPGPDAEAVVVALKTRTVRPEKAVRQSMEAAEWLLGCGAERIFFKYCSTFDSTESGNIGPVAEALADRLAPDLTLFCPSFPANGRTVYQGHLFVEGRLLSESSLANHPLTPMTDPCLERVLQKQCRDSKVGLIALETVEQGTGAILAAMEGLQADGCRFAITDALDEGHLLSIADAGAAQPLLTGGSAVAAGLPAVYRLEGKLREEPTPVALDTVPGTVAILSGSCSEASRRQVSAMAQRCRSVEIDALALSRGEIDTDTLLAQAGDVNGPDAVIFYSTTSPENVSVVQQTLGRRQSGQLVEDTMAELAAALVERGVRKLIVAGGETSGAVARKLGLTQLRVGPEIDPGVPWMQNLGEPQLLLAFKSGNFGTDDFFIKAVEMAA